MEALEIEGQTDQAPFASRRCRPTQGELAEAENLFDDPDDWFNRAFACPVDRFAQRSPELVSHFDLRTGILRRWIGQRGKPLLPTRMMGIAACCDIWLDSTLRTGSERRGAKVASVQRCCLGSADYGRDSFQRRFGFLTIIGMIGEGPSHGRRRLP